MVAYSFIMWKAKLSLLPQTTVSLRFKVEFMSLHQPIIENYPQARQSRQSEISLNLKRPVPSFYIHRRKKIVWMTQPAFLSIRFYSWEKERKFLLQDSQMKAN